MIQPRVGLYAVYEPAEEGWSKWRESIDHVGQALSNQGLTVLIAPEAVIDPASCARVADWLAAQDLDLLHALIVSWSFDHYTVRIQQKTRLPLAIRAIPGIRSGSVVGSQQLQSLLYDLEVEHRTFYGPPDSSEPAQAAAVYARACGIRKRLAEANIGVIGRRTEGMTPTAVDEIEILRLFGARLLNYGLDELQTMAEAVELTAGEVEWDRFSAAARGIASQREHGVSSARLLLALQRLAAEQNLQAISIGSYPHCQGTLCIPIAQLNEDGVPSGCEGDVNSTIVMFLLRQLCDAPVHFGEMLALDFDENSIVTSHCGCGSPSLADADGFMLHPVRLANDGVCIRFTARPGPVTFVNLVGRKGNYRMCAFEGHAVRTGMVFEGNPLKLVTKTPLQKIWNATVQGGFGHHWMTAYTHAAAELREFCRLTGITGCFPDLEAA